MFCHWVIPRVCVYWVVVCVSVGDYSVCMVLNGGGCGLSICVGVGWCACVF